MPFCRVPKGLAEEAASNDAGLRQRRANENENKPWKRSNNNNNSAGIISTRLEDCHGVGAFLQIFLTVQVFSSGRRPPQFTTLVLPITLLLQMTMFVRYVCHSYRIRTNNFKQTPSPPCVVYFSWTKSAQRHLRDPSSPRTK